MWLTGDFQFIGHMKGKTFTLLYHQPFVEILFAFQDFTMIYADGSLFKV